MTFPRVVICVRTGAGSWTPERLCSRGWRQAQMCSERQSNKSKHNVAPGIDVRTIMFMLANSDKYFARESNFA